MLKLMIAAASLCATIAQARAFDLSAQQINDLVAGATVEIDTPIGTKLPIRYGRDGKLAGEAGDLAWYLGSASDRGRWWVASDQLCHKWSRWFNSEPKCMRLSKEGRTIRWRTQDGDGGTARISVHASTQAAAVPLEQANRLKEAVPPKALPEPASAPKLNSEPSEQPAEAAVGAGQPPPGPIIKEAAAPPPPMPARATSDKAPPPQKQAEPEREDRAESKRAGLPRFRVANLRSDDVLNVRSGPSADHNIVGELPPGSRGIAITSACRSQWCPVQHHTARGWVNSAYLAPEEPLSPLSALPDSREAPRTCLTPAARALLDRIEGTFGPVQVISTCRPGATMPGTWRGSRHASGNAVDFKAGSRKAAIVEWLIANHRRGGTMTYPGMDHIHVDIGPHFVSIANGPHWSSWRDGRRDFSGLPTAGERR